MKKFIATSLLSATFLGLLFSNTQSVLAMEKTMAPQVEDIRPLVNWGSTAYLTTNAYSNVTSSNNIFNDRPLVTNSANNPGPIMVRIVNTAGQVIGSTKTILTGRSVRLDAIPAFSGTYTLQAKATTKTGNYFISID